MATTVVIAHGQPVFRAGLRQELSRRQSLAVVGEAECGEVAERLVLKLKPTVLLLDTGLHGMPAYYVAARLRDSSAGTRVVATGPLDRDTIVQMLTAGATGYVLEDEPPARFARALEAVGHGDTWLSALAAQAIATLDAPPPAGAVPLTPREHQVLALVANAQGNRSIAATLGISTPTVRFHVRNLYRKLGLSGRAELTAWASRLPGPPDN